MAYIPNPADASQPVESVFAKTAAAEFRALKQRVNDIVAGGGPGAQTPGMIAYFASPTAAPPGWLEADGSLQLRSNYPALWATISGQGWPTSDATWLTGYFGYFSSGDGSTTFRLPDLRGVFIRGWNHGKAGNIFDPSRQTGNLQQATELFDNGGNASALIFPWTGFAANMNSDFAGGLAMSYNSVSPASSASSVVSTRGVRPTNIALMPCIKT